MNLYKTIALSYDRIFPVNDKTLAFVGSPSGSSSVLDIGCATGGHCIALAQAGWHATGIDPSPTMIEAAGKAKRFLAPEIASRVAFEVAGMLDVSAMPADRRFGLLLCTGNTVPHLASEQELMRFLAACKKIMESGARMIIQILNYAKILAEKPDMLPCVQGDDFLFSRQYKYNDDGSVSFDTTFERDGIAGRDSTRLWPFTPDALRLCISEAGLKVTNSYGSWDRKAFDEKNDIQLILELRL